MLKTIVIADLPFNALHYLTSIPFCQQKSYEKPAFIFYFFGLISYVMLMGYCINFSASFTLRRFAWGCTGGAITGAQNFLKDSLTIIKATDSQQKLPLIFYPLSLLAGSTAFVGLLFLTACMKRYDATYSAASFVGSFVVSASIMAAVHYDTFSQLSGVLNYILYPCGIIVLMVGVYLLVRDSSESMQENNSTDQRRQQDININEEVDFDSEVRILKFGWQIIAYIYLVPYSTKLEHFVSYQNYLMLYYLLLYKDAYGYTEVEDVAREDVLL